MLDVFGEEESPQVMVFYHLRALRMLQETKESGPKAWRIDEQAYPVIKALNTIPGVNTTWSCQGHPVFANNKWHTGKLYYAMVATEEGRAELRRLHNKLLDHLERVFAQRYQLKGIDNHACLLVYKEGRLWCEELKCWYPTTQFEAVSEHDWVLKVINEEMAAYINRMVFPPINYGAIKNVLGLVDREEPVAKAE